MVAGLAEIGGAERVLLDLMSSIRKVKPAWAIHLVVPGRGPLSIRAEALGVDVRVLEQDHSIARLGESGMRESASVQARVAAFAQLALELGHAIPSIARYGFGLRRMLSEIAPDVVHTHGMKPHVIATIAAARKCTVVWHMHDLLAERPVMSQVLKRLARRVDATIAISTCVAEQLRAVCGRSVDPTIILNAVDLDVFCPSGPKIDLDELSSLPPPLGKIVRVGLVGTSGRFKGHDVFIDAIAQIDSSIPIRAYVIGGAVYRARNSQINENTLRGNAESRGLSIGFTGYVSNPAAAMRALDIVVHATVRPEPFGLVVAEAMACGRAVIGTDAGGVREIITPRLDGLTYPSGDARSLAEAITALSTDTGLRARLGYNARRSAETKFDSMRLANEVAAVYQTALRSREAEEQDRFRGCRA